MLDVYVFAMWGFIVCATVAGGTVQRVVRSARRLGLVPLDNDELDVWVGRLPLEDDLQQKQPRSGAGENDVHGHLSRKQVL